MTSCSLLAPSRSWRGCGRPQVAERGPRSWRPRRRSGADRHASSDARRPRGAAGSARRRCTAPGPPVLPPPGCPLRSHYIAAAGARRTRLAWSIRPGRRRDTARSGVAPRGAESAARANASSPAPATAVEQHAGGERPLLGDAVDRRGRRELGVVGGRPPRGPSEAWRAEGPERAIVSHEHAERSLRYQACAHARRRRQARLVDRRRGLRRVRLSVVARITEEVAALHRAGVDVVVVTSGAIARGVQLLELPVRPTGSRSCRPPARSGRAGSTAPTTSCCASGASRPRRCCSRSST